MRSYKFKFFRRASSAIGTLMLCADFCSLALAQDTEGYSSLGFGNVHINFETPSGYLMGFRDYLNYTAGIQTGTQVGPINYVGNYGGGSESASDDDSITFFRLTDDIDNNGVPGAIIVFVPSPDDPSILIPTTLTDFGDLHTFNIAFDEIGVAQQRGYQTSDIGGVYWVYEEENEGRSNGQVAAGQAENAISTMALDPLNTRRGTEPRVVSVRARTPSRFVPQFSKFAQGRRGSGIGLTYGYNEFNLFDRFYFEGNGGILGRTYSDTQGQRTLTSFSDKDLH